MQTFTFTSIAASTADLWDTAHCALVSKQWSKATKALEALMGRSDNADLLADAKAYDAPEHLLQFLQDRIDACNRYAR